MVTFTNVLSALLLLMIFITMIIYSTYTREEIYNADKITPVKMAFDIEVIFVQLLALVLYSTQYTPVNVNIFWIISYMLLITCFITHILSVGYKNDNNASIYTVAHFDKCNDIFTIMFFLFFMLYAIMYFITRNNDNPADNMLFILFLLSFICLICYSKALHSKHDINVPNTDVAFEENNKDIAFTIFISVFIIFLNLS